MAGTAARLAAASIMSRIPAVATMTRGIVRCGQAPTGFRRRQQGAILSAQGLNAAKIDIVQQIDAFALNRFDDKSRDIARRQGFLQRRDMVEWNCAAAGNEVAEAIRNAAIASSAAAIICRAASLFVMLAAASFELTFTDGSKVPPFSQQI